MENFRGSETILCDVAMLDMCHCTFVKTRGLCDMPRANPDMNGGLGVIMTCQCGFIGYDECALRWGVNRWGGHASRGTGRVWELAVLAIHFFCEPKIGLKNTVY